MKFSLSFLLISMVLVCLVVNIWNTIRLTEVQRTKCELLANEIGARNYESDHADQIERIYNRSFAAFQKREAAFALAVAKFEKLADKYSVLRVSDPSRIHLVESEVLEPKDGFHERFRIWIPDSPAFKLQLGFNHSDNRFVRKRELRSSKFFEPADLFATPLEQGESIVDLIGTRKDDTFRIQLMVNENVVHAAVKTLPESKIGGHSRTAISMKDCIDLNPESRTILSIDAHNQGNQNECITVGILALDQDGEER